MELFTALVIAALTGLTFLAYRHPEAFAKLFQVLMYVAGGLIAASTVWTIAITVAYSRFLPLIEDNQAATRVLDQMKPNEILIFAAWIGVVIYLNFLRALPYLIKGNAAAAKNEEA